MFEDYDDDSRDGHYSTAQVCLNGHSITGDIEENKSCKQDFCAECGAKTVTQCSNCKKPIRGLYYAPNILYTNSYDLPKFCYACGSAFPWTETAISAAKEYSREIEKLSKDEISNLENCIDDLIKSSPKTPTAIIRFKKLMQKAGRNAAEGMKQILVDVLSETAKKALWP